MSPFANASLLWLDLELTDLDVKKGKIVEISTLITDGQLNIKAEGPSLVIHQPEEVLSSMVMWNQNNFTQSGLMY